MFLTAKSELIILCLMCILSKRHYACLQQEDKKRDGSRDVLIDGFHHSASLHRQKLCLCVCGCQVKTRSGNHELRPPREEALSQILGKNESNSPGAVGLFL